MKPRPPVGCAVRNGRYYRVQYAGTVGGKRKQVWHPLTRVSEGLPALYRALADLGDVARRQNISVQARIDEWLQDFLPGHAAAEQKEQARMANVIAQAFIEFDTKQVQAKHVHTFLQGWVRAGKRRTAQRYRNTLGKFFRWVILQGDRTDNPVDPVAVPAPAPNMRYMDDEAFTLIREKLLGDAGHKAASGVMMQAYVDLAYLTGHGGVDIRTLRWTDIDFEAGLIRVKRSKVAKKTGVRVDIAITRPIRNVLARARKHMTAQGRVSPYVIQNLDGSPYSASGVGTAWERARERAATAMPDRADELRAFTLKDLRAKFATDAKAQGYTDEQIAAGLAHVDTNTTTIYLKKRLSKTSNIDLEIPK